MSKVVITPRREKGDPQLPEKGLFLVNPSEASLAGRYAKEAGWQRYFLFNSNLYVNSDPDGSFFVAGPAVGAPMAVMALEKLIALGAKKIIALGWCGSLSEKLQVGDILLPTETVCEEGTSAHYPVEGLIKPDSGLLQTLSSQLANLNGNVHQGGCWTTDAPFRELREKVSRYRENGILGVDMETSALLNLAAFRSVKLASVLLVSDETWREPWQPMFNRKAFKQKSRLLFETLLTNFRLQDRER